MHFFSTLISVIIEFLIWLFKKGGINAVLVLVLIIEIPIMIFYYNETCTDYRYEDVYRMERVTEIIPLTYKELPNYTFEQFQSGTCYRLVNIQFGNYYINDVTYPNLYIEDQNGNSIDSDCCDYYDNLYLSYQYGGECVIPPGTVVNIPCILSIPSQKLYDIDKLVIYDSYTSADVIPDSILEEDGLLLKTTFNK